MPRAGLRSCPIPGCPELVAHGRCAAHGGVRREERQSHERGYDWRWRKARERLLRAWCFECGADRGLPAAPNCRRCKGTGKANLFCYDPFGIHGDVLVPAEALDHVIPHRGSFELFWRESNIAGICFSCHGIKSARERFGQGA